MVMAHTLILTVHIAVGLGGILLGPVAIALAVSGRLVDRVGWVVEAYHASVLAVCLSAVGLVALEPARLWWFLPIAAGSYAFALRARLALHRRSVGWQRRSVSGLGGAYIALWTAILVVSANGTPLLWALPTVVGVPLIEWMARHTRENGPEAVAPAV